MIFKKEPFFNGADNVDQLAKITKVLGSDLLDEYLEAYDLELSPELAERIGRHVPRKDWMSFVNADNKERVCPDVVDLIDKMLRYDPAARVLPKEAMEHKFFETVRQKDATNA